MLTAERYDGDGREWDAYAEAQADASYAHWWGWGDVIGGALGHRWTGWIARDGAGRWEGLLPLVRVRTPFLGHYLISVPFVNGGGPLGHPEARDLLTRLALADARTTGVASLELRGRSPPSAPLAVSDRKISVVLPLPTDPAALWQGFPSKLRSQVRRAERAGLRAAFGPDQRAAFYHVFSQNMHALGTPVLPAEFFARIAATMGERALFAAVYLDDLPVAAGCGFLWRDTFEITWASSLRSANPLAPNMLLYWALMREAIARGARTFDFGRCSPGSSTHAFKRQWGGSDVALPWGEWQRDGRATRPTPDRPAFRLASACWRRLPAPVAARLGPPISRWFP